MNMQDSDAAVNGASDSITLNSLSQYAVWIGWKLIQRESGMPTKVPYSSDDFPASSTCPKRWVTRAEAERYAAASGAEGIGLMFCGLGDGTAICGLDYDTCVAADGAIAPWALDRITLLDSYAEVSPSGSGIKQLFRLSQDAWDGTFTLIDGYGAKWPQEGGQANQVHPPAIELHIARRYFAVTGKRLDSSPEGIRTLSKVTLLELLNGLGPKMTKVKHVEEDAGEIKPVDPEDVAAKLASARQWDTRLEALLDGRFPDQKVPDDRGIDRSARAFHFAAVLKGNGFSLSEVSHILRINAWTKAWAADNDDRQIKRAYERADNRKPAWEEFDGEEAPEGYRPLGGEQKYWEQPQQQAREAKRRSRQFLSLADLKALPPGSWLVQDIIEEAALVAVYGLPASGKSFLVLSLALHIAAGLPWFGREVLQGAVVYVAAEGSRGMRRRAEAMQAVHSIGDDVPFWLLPATVNFNDAADVTGLVKDIRDLVPADVPIRLVIFDTLFWMANGLDLNSPGGMGVAVGALGKVKEGLNCTAMAVHHEGKDATKGMLGSINLLGALDTTIQTKRDEKTNNVTLQTKKQKDGDPGAPLVFAMESVTTSDGRSTLLPKLIEGAKQTDEASLTGQAKLAFQALQGTIAGHGKRLPNGKYGVTAKLWQEQFYDSLMTKPDETPKAAANRKWMAFDRAAKKLCSDQILGTGGEWAWIVAQQSEFDTSAD